MTRSGSRARLAQLVSRIAAAVLARSLASSPNAEDRTIAASLRKVCREAHAGGAALAPADILIGALDVWAANRAAHDAGEPDALRRALDAAGEWAAHLRHTAGQRRIGRALIMRQAFLVDTAIAEIRGHISRATIAEGDS